MLQLLQFCIEEVQTFRLSPNKKKKKKSTPGRRPANINQGIHVGLSQTSIGVLLKCCVA